MDGAVDHKFYLVRSALFRHCGCGVVVQKNKTALDLLRVIATSNSYE